MRLAFCALAVAGWCCVDAGPAQTSILQGFKETELTCFTQRKIYYPADKKCHTLPDVDSGVCPEGEWLVLDTDRINSNNRFEPRCKKKVCADKPFETFWPANQTCVKITAYKTLCPKGNEVMIDKFGEGMCTCRKLPPHLPLSITENPSECFELYTQGACKAGQVLHAEHVKNKGRVAVCRPDPCAQKTAQRKKAHALYSKDNKCYPLKEEKPCPSPLTFQVSQRTFVPDCEGDAYSIFTLPARCSHDQAGDCKKEIILLEEDKESEAFNLITGGRRKRKRSSPSPKR